jgi:formate-dependent nitrite reductase cytochrome c552 subunit
MQPFPKAVKSILLLVVCATIWTVGCRQSDNSAQSEATKDQTPVKTTAFHPVVITPRPEITGVKTEQLDHAGKAVVLKCQACHSLRPANLTTTRSEQLDEFHQGLRIAHGNLTCASCHNPGDGYQTLRLADGRSLAFKESMQLCAQCHGTQFRDYQHGSHGGMTGYWDLSKGGRTRNHCVQCHDPHAPKFQTFIPAAVPRDRFPPAQSGAHHD